MNTLKTLSPLPEIPSSPTNAYADNPQAAMLGQKFFFDKSVSGPLGPIGSSGGLGAVGETGKIGCNSCHVAQTWFIDTRSMPNNLSSGADGYLAHNAPSLVNSVFYTWFRPDGARDSQWRCGATAFETIKANNSTRLTLAHHLYDAYRNEYDGIFVQKLDSALDPNAPDAARFPPSGKPKANPTDPDGPWEMMQPSDQIIVNRIVANYGKALEAYMRLLISRDAPFDRFVAGDAQAVSELAKQGAALFVGKAGCIRCHYGPKFTDNAFHVLGVPQTGPNVPSIDQGRFSAIPQILNNVFNTAGIYSDNPQFGENKLSGLGPLPSDMGAFRTPTLRNIAVTAPYMHTGGFATLESVVDFLNAGGGDVETLPDGPQPIKDPRIVPLGLTDSEKKALVEFLKTLTGQPIPMTLTTPP